MVKKFDGAMHLFSAVTPIFQGYDLHNVTMDSVFFLSRNRKSVLVCFMVVDWLTKWASVQICLLTALFCPKTVLFGVLEKDNFLISHNLCRITQYEFQSVKKNCIERYLIILQNDENEVSP